jgi:hypothetical protein
VEAGCGERIVRADEHRRSTHTISRSEVFAALYLLGIVNAWASLVFSAIFGEQPWRTLAEGRDLNILVVALPQSAFTFCANRRAHR